MCIIIILHVLEHVHFMFTCTSYVHMYIYIADMHLKEVSKCTITYGRSIFITSNSNVIQCCVDPMLCRSIGIRILGLGCSRWHSRKQMRPYFLNEAILVKIRNTNILSMLQ